MLQFMSASLHQLSRFNHFQRVEKSSSLTFLLVNFDFSLKAALNHLMFSQTLVLNFRKDKFDCLTLFPYIHNDSFDAECMRFYSIQHRYHNQANALDKYILKMHN